MMLRSSSPSPSFLAQLSALDKELSRPLFEAQVPYPVEVLWSIPGNFFGIPLFACWIAPSLVTIWLQSVLFAETTNIQSDYHIYYYWWWQGTIIVYALFLALLGLWWNVMMATCDVASSVSTRILYGPILGALSPVLGVALLEWFGSRTSSTSTSSSSATAITATATSVGHFIIAAWCVAIVPVAVLKPWIQRPRPVLYHPRNIHNKNNNKNKNNNNAKHLKALHSILCRDGRAAFPSGDAAGSVAVAYPLLRMPSLMLSLQQQQQQQQQQNTASSNIVVLVGLLCIGLSVTGRVYWQAHSLGDTLAGVVLAFGMCRALEIWLEGTSANEGGAIFMCDWSHALGSWAVLLTVVILSRWRNKKRIFGVGTLATTETAVPNRNDVDVNKTTCKKDN